MDVTMAMVFDGLSRVLPCSRGHYFDSSYSVYGASSLKNDGLLDAGIGVCYVTRYPSLALSAHIPPEAIIAIGEQEAFEHPCSIIVRQDIDVEELHSIIESVIDSYVLWADDLLDLNVHGSGIEEMVDYAHGMFGNPVTIIDGNYRLLAYTHNDMMDDFLWVTEEDRYDDVRFQKGVLKESEFVEYFEMLNKRGFLFNYVAKTGVPLMACLVRTDSESVYSINIIQKNRPITEGDYQCLRYFGKIIEAKIRAIEATWFDASSGYTALLHDIVRGNLVDAEDIKARLGSEWMHVLPMFTVAIVAAREGFLKYHELCMLQDKLEPILPEGVCVIHARTLVVFINHEDGLAVKERLESIDFLQDRGLIVGVSESRYDDCSLHDLVRQAQIALRVGRKEFPDKCIYDFDSCRIFYLIDLISHEEDWHRCLHPCLAIIEEHDKKTPASPLMPTLRCLIENYNNRMLTAKELGIQRNTLQYRLGKIEQLCDIDLSDNATFDDVIFSMTLRDYCKDR